MPGPTLPHAPSAHPARFDHMMHRASPIRVRRQMRIVRAHRAHARITHAHITPAWLIVLTCVVMTAPCAAQWTRLLPALPCGGDSSLYTVCTLGGDCVWTVGEDAAAYRSTAVGAAFTPMDMGGRFDLYGISFRTPRTGIACGDSGRIVRTTDGGITWNLSRTSAAGTRALYHIAWIDSATVIATGGASSVAHGSAAIPDGVILRSTDAGATWNAMRTDITQFFWRLTVETAASGAPRVHATSYGPLSQGSILTSGDAGTTWSVTATLPFLPHDLATITTDAGTWMLAAGGNPLSLGAAPRLAVRAPGGAWTVLPDTFSVRGFAWSALAFTDSARTGRGDVPVLLAGLHSGMLLESLDGGGTWHPSDVVSPCPVYDLAAAHADPGSATVPTTFYAAGSGRGLFRRSTAVSGIRLPDPELLYDLLPPWPNPASGGTVTIAWRARAPHAGTARIVITDLLGRVLAQHAVAPDVCAPNIPASHEPGPLSAEARAEGSWTPDISALPSGLYSIRMTGPGAQAMRLLCVQR